MSPDPSIQLARGEQPVKVEGKICLHELAIRYHTQSGSVLALDTTDLTFGTGEFVVLLGPS
jgi:ABC-type sugar transport system ATPase subunit